MKRSLHDFDDFVLFSCLLHLFFSMFGEVHDQVRLEGLVKNKGLAVFLEMEEEKTHGELMKHI